MGQQSCSCSCPKPDKQPEVDICANPMPSVGGEYYGDGCAGAVSWDGSQSQNYCAGKDLAHKDKHAKYYEQCCQWNGSRCIDKA